ncbi:TPA: hypothetical protein ACLZDI_001425 [Streptococcus pneumoniae]
MKADQLRHKSDLGLRGLAIIAKNEIIAFCCLPKTTSYASGSIELLAW